MSVPDPDVTKIGRNLRVCSRTTMGHQLKRSGSTQTSSAYQELLGTRAKSGHTSFRYATHLSSIETITMKGFNNPGLHVGCADPLPLHRVPPARPLGINPQITRGDFNWGQKVGPPSLLELILGVHAIDCIYDHRQRFEHIPVAITQKHHYQIPHSEVPEGVDGSLE
eukprot:3868947-Amphidinium_carterae.1